MKKAIIASTVVAATTIGLSASVDAGGKSDLVQIHPGHWGYIQTEGNGGGVPAAHFHDFGGYETGPGGWGATVSSTVKGGGNPHR